MARRSPKRIGGSLVHEQEFAGATHDFTPWVEVNSSRMQRIRYDHATGNVQVDWGNGNPAYVYREVGYEVWRSFIRASSKGKFINRRLESASSSFDPVSTDEMELPSNGNRRAPLSGSRNIIGVQT